MNQEIPDFAPSMDRSGSFWRDMTRDSIRPGELPKQPLHSVPAALDIRITLSIGAFQIALRHQPRTAMAGADDIYHVQVKFFDQPVQVDIDEVEPGSGAPMPEQTRLDVFELEWGFEQRIVLQIDLPNGEIVCGAPIGIHLLQQIGR